MNYVEDLQKQNASLKELIAEMRLQMESLGQEGQRAEVKSFNVADSFSVHKEELEELKRENRELKVKLKSSRRAATGTSHLPTAQDSEEILSQVEGNMTVKQHILALNSTIGTLRSEKVELAATVKKQQARIAFLENSLEETSKLPRQKQIQIDQLTYELSSCRRRQETEVAGLKNRVSELEFQLTEARREADEYHRASLERNEELVALGNQLSALKLEFSESNPTINFGAQELYIQQLQDELAQLRKRATAFDISDLNNIGSKFASLDDGSASSSDVRHKLKMAAARIIQLARENQQLTESNNRLRAQLKSTVSEKTASDAGVPSKSEMFVRDKQRSDGTTEKADDSKTAVTQDRLEQLEKLQYQLTRQELKFAQRVQTRTRGVSLQPADSLPDDVPERDTSGSSMRYRRPATGVQPGDVGVGISAQSTFNNQDSEMMVSFSSGGGDSIQQVWQMLESSSSIGPSSPRSARSILPGQRKPSDGGDHFYLQGQSAPAEARSRKEQSLHKSGIDYPEKLKKQVKPKPKIRNYNFRDDSSRR
ncbi:unnamed protein product [Candidula unifasciata]|uniref:Uncharacterized protein n=1 Tax=Candidula unifasciata TaxID=100452 RepID=A0A8S3Z6G1_9EUPU|nr:unnamed protein product [Candidula unifasciata]